jgi:hypothetical protein
LTEAIEKDTSHESVMSSIGQEETLVPSVGTFLLVFRFKCIIQQYPLFQVFLGQPSFERSVGLCYFMAEIYRKPSGG